MDGWIDGWMVGWMVEANVISGIGYGIWITVLSSQLFSFSFWIMLIIS